MISCDKIWVFSITILGFVMIFSEAAMLISRKLTKEENYRIDLEITKHIDRFYNVYRRAELWNVYENTRVKNEFEFFMEEDDNVKELIHYMQFIGTSGPFFDNLTLSYSILYTKYKAAFYAVNILNIYKIKRPKFEPLDNDSINIILKNHENTIFNVYLKIGQYLAWYALTGNDILLEDIKTKLLEKIPCAEESYTEFRQSFNNILGKMEKKIFQTMDSVIKEKRDSSINLDEFWKDIYEKSTQDIQIINRYFATIFSKTKEEDITVEDFIKTFSKETSIAEFVSDLSVIKGRDIEETYINFDNKPKKELYESNITNMMMVIEQKEMKLVQDKGQTEQTKDDKRQTEQTKEDKGQIEQTKDDKDQIEQTKDDKGQTEQRNAQSNREYLILQPLTKEQLFTCLQMELVHHEVLWEEEVLGLQQEEEVTELQPSTNEE